MNNLVNRIKNQIQLVKNEIHEITDKIAVLRDEGDSSDVGVSTEFQDRLDILREKIDILQKSLATYQNTKTSNSVDIGNTIEFTINTKTKYLTLVLPEDADTQEGLISIESPLGQAFLTKKKGESVTITTPRGEMNYKLTNIK